MQAKPQTLFIRRYLVLDFFSLPPFVLLLFFIFTPTILLNRLYIV